MTLALRQWYLQGSYVCGLQTFLSLLYFKFHVLAFGQCFEALGLNGREVDKDIRALLLLNETKAFGFVKPLHFASCF